jgi:hypothetical protein
VPKLAAVPCPSWLSFLSVLLVGRIIASADSPAGGRIKSLGIGDRANLMLDGRSYNRRDKGACIFRRRPQIMTEIQSTSWFTDFNAEVMRATPASFFSAMP